MRDRATIRPMSQRLDIRLRIDFGRTCSVGPGKIVLLEQIARTGSLSQAARELGMSYRRAWQLLDDLNHSFNEAVATAGVGGAGGGGVQLTAFGEELIAAYRDVERTCLEVARTRFAGVIKEPEPAKSLKSKLRRLLFRRTPKRRKLSAARDPSIL
jgi:molybdate transport system regulatory protein